MRSRATTRRAGFTLVEILVVIAIIALLSSVGFILAHKVTAGGKSRLSLDTIRVLDTLVGAYQGDVSDKFPIKYTDAKGTDFPIIDAQAASPTPADFYNAKVNPAEPSLALFLLAAKDSPAVDTALKSLESKLVSYGPIVSNVHASQPSPLDSQGNPIRAISINDGWGRPIRFVHPKFDGGYGPFIAGTATSPTNRDGRKIEGMKLTGAVQGGKEWYRTIRAATTAEIGTGDEGLCPGNRPYFYSSGQDGNPGTRDDNVYSTKPTFPTETAKEP